ncbi:hypothetical protein HY416_04150 [Candidatus Kaiserbacteria bacterium]|nr:hypothetical protein [Candidatus Kaiserbacteria bacterium]
MNQRAIIVAVVLFAVIVLGMFLYARFKSDTLRTAEPAPVTSPVNQPSGITHVDAKHFFKDGMHTVAGEIMMPTPCDLLEVSPISLESSLDEVTLAFRITNSTEGVCAQVVTPQRFKVSFEANEGATIKATFKGEPVTLNLIEAGPDENPDDFEVFIKG